MDEPHLTSQIDDTEPSAEKPDLNEVLDSAFGSGELEKPMDVDSVAIPQDQPSTSAESELPDDIIDSAAVSKEPTPEPAVEEAGHAEDVSMSEDLPNETVEQINFEKPSDELDETAQSAIEHDTLDFTERSINISQLNVEHHDDSNDAFNALKESETDALQTPKDEVEEPKEDESPHEPETGAVDDDAVVEIPDEVAGEKEPDESIETPMETEETDADKTDANVEPVDETMDESHEVGTETADLDDDGSMGPPESVEKPDNDDAEEIPDGEFSNLNS
jgi:hypothetical protein